MRLGLNTYIYKGKVKSSKQAYNQCEKQGKWLWGRDPDRSRCHLHTSVKLFLLQPMAQWSLVAAHECAANQSMDPWAVTKKACGRDTSSCLGLHPMATCPVFHISCRLGRELFTLPLCCHQCPWSHGLRPKKHYHTRSVYSSCLIPYQKTACPEFHIG